MIHAVSLLALAMTGCVAVRNDDATPPADSGAGVVADPIGALRREFRFDSDSPSIPAGLVAACGGARVVGLGELSHGTHEDALLKSALALALIDAGQVDTVYIEANRTGGEQLDSFLRSEGGDARAAVRDASIFRVLKTEAFAYLVAGMQERVARGRTLRIVGIDCQDSRPDAEFALTRLAARDAPLAERLRAGLAPILGPLAAAGDAAAGAPAQANLRHPQLIKSLDTARLHTSIAACRALRAALAEDTAAAVAAERAAQGLLSFEHEVSDGDAAKIDGDYFSRRDRYMAENILANGPIKGAFWGHNVHILGGPRDVMQGYVSSGTILREALGRDYRIVVCDYGSARISAVISQPGSALPDATGAKEIVTRDLLSNGLAAAVTGAKPRSCWLDLASAPSSVALDAWRAIPREFDWPDYAAPRERNAEQLFPIALGQLVDVIVVLESVGPARWLVPD